jgi:hypothetical protein
MCRCLGSLHKHLQATGLEFMQFAFRCVAVHNLSWHVGVIQMAFRWMNCLLLRELTPAMNIRLWDTYLAESPGKFAVLHVYVCAAMICHFSARLQTLDFQDLIVFLQHMQTYWEQVVSAEMQLQQILAQAFIWMSAFEDRGRGPGRRLGLGM